MAKGNSLVRYNSTPANGAKRDLVSASVFEPWLLKTGHLHALYDSLRQLQFSDFCSLMSLLLSDSIFLNHSIYSLHFKETVQVNVQKLYIVNSVDMTNAIIVLIAYCTYE